MLTLIEVKQFLRIDADYTGYDAMLQLLIDAVKEKIEGQINCGLSVEARNYEWDGYSRVQLPYSPLVSVDSISPDQEYVVSGDYILGSQTGSGQWFYPISGGAIYEPYYSELPSVTVSYTSGYETVPAGLKTAMLALIDHIYYSRGTIADPLPGWVMSMVARYDKNSII